MACLHPQILKQTHNGRFHSFIFCGSGLSPVNIFMCPRSCSQATKHCILSAERPGRSNHNNLESADYSYSVYCFDHSHYQELPPSDKHVSVSVKTLSRLFTVLLNFFDCYLIFLDTSSNLGLAWTGLFRYSPDTVEWYPGAVLPDSDSSPVTH